MCKHKTQHSAFLAKAKKHHSTLGMCPFHFQREKTKTKKKEPKTLFIHDEKRDWNEFRPPSVKIPPNC